MSSAHAALPTALLDKMQKILIFELTATNLRGTLRQLTRRGIAPKVPELALGEIAATVCPTGIAHKAAGLLDPASRPMRLAPTQEQRLHVVARLAQRRFPGVRDAIAEAHLGRELAGLMDECAEVADACDQGSEADFTVPATPPPRGDEAARCSNVRGAAVGSARWCRNVLQEL